MQKIRNFKNKNGTATVNYNPITKMFEIEMETPDFSTFDTASNFDDAMAQFEDNINELKQS